MAYPGIFSHRSPEGGCNYFGGLCPVRQEQRNPNKDVCKACIPTREEKGDGRKRRHGIEAH